MDMTDAEKETSPWIRLDLSFWDEIIGTHCPKLYRKNTFLFQQGDPPDYVYIIKSGRVRITSYQLEGGEKQLYIAETGAMCGELACIQHSPYTVSAVTIVDSHVYCLPYVSLEKYIDTHAAFAKKLMHILCRKSHIFMEQVLELSFNPSFQRVARILLNIADQYGKIYPDQHIHITIKFTHQDVANMINTSRVTVSNVFNSFSSAGIISREQGYYILKDINKLKEYAVKPK
jgi:CRP/FNR family transcriptional regulator